MPRPNAPRTVFAEAHLASRITIEREALAMTYEGLAERMTRVGCPIDRTAIYKIEKGTPRRRIVVDELVAFAKVFGVPVQDLLLPPELKARSMAGDLVLAWQDAEDEVFGATAAYNDAVAARDAAWTALSEHVAEHPDLKPLLEQFFVDGWAKIIYAENEERQAFAAAEKMWHLTRDDAWRDRMKASFDALVAAHAADSAAPS